MQETIVKFLSERGTLVQPEALDYLTSLSDPLDRLKEGFSAGHEAPFVLTLEHARSLTEGEDRSSTPEPKQLPEPASKRARPSGRRDDEGTGERPSRPPDDAEPSPEPEPPENGAAASAVAKTAEETTETTTEAAAETTAETATEPTPEPPGPPQPAPDDAEPSPEPEPVGRPTDDETEAVATEPTTEPATTPAPEPDAGEPSGSGVAHADEPDVADDARDPETEATLGPAAQAIADRVRVDLDITGESTCEGEIEDFTKLFRDRYNRMDRLMKKNRRQLYGATTVADLTPGDDAKVIGLVKDVKTTKNGHRIIELEDDTGETVVLAPEDEDRLIELSDRILLDEVVGIVGKKLPDRGNKDGLLVMEELVRLDLRLDRRRPDGMRGSAVFVSDVHLGADTFLADAWDGLVDWLVDRAATGPDDDGVKYLVVAGDLVEGVGVYPGQEKILHVPDVYDQYQEAARTLDRLPEEVHVIIQPGNHDTVVRLPEPQPALPEEIHGFFGDNVRFVGNPCRIGFDDIELLSYHGVSLFDYFEALPNCNIDKPVETMEEMLRRRHLCPTFGGGTPLAPEHRDHLIIEEEPDIFVTGHVHAARTGEYRGTRLINASTWQAQTDYQRMRGFDPDPCKCFEVDLSTLGVTTWNFDHAEGTGEVEVDQADVSRRKVGAIAE